MPMDELCDLGGLGAAGWLDWLAALSLDQRLDLPDGTRLLATHTCPVADRTNRGRASFSAGPHTARRQRSTTRSRRPLTPSPAGTSSSNVTVRRCISPLDGWVVRTDFEPGEMVPAGMPVVVVADLPTLTIKIYLPEDQFGRPPPREGVDV